MSDKIEALQKYDTPSITNVVATYPGKSTCMGLYHPWETDWYTDQSLKCMFPELGPRAGYVVTCVYGMVDPSFKQLGFVDVLRAIKASPKPVILAVKQNFPPHLKDKIGLMGGNMMTAFKTAGVVGVLSDGPSRDLDEVRPIGLQYMLTGLTPGHGDMAVQAVNVPVTICGMAVAPGECVHMDSTGAVKFPAQFIDEIDRRCAESVADEAKMQKLMRECDPDDVERLGRLIGGIYD